MIARCALFFAVFLASCTGYQLGTARPSHLQAVSVIHVEMVDNKTQIPRAAAHATNALADAFTRDGTYRLGSSDRADARLSTVLHTIDYEQIRSSENDTLRSEELEMTIEFHWSLVDAENPLHILESGTTIGRTRFFVDPNLQTARQTAITDALQRASETVVARLANGF